MASAKEIFKRNLMRIAEQLGIPGGTALSRLTESDGKPGIEKTYGNSLLNPSDNPINLTFDKAEILAKALGVTIQDLLNPGYFDAKKGLIADAKDIETLAEAIKTVKAIADREAIENPEFESRLAAYLYFDKMNNVSEGDRYGEVARITREFLK